MAVLGGGQGSLEALLLKRRIKGPCWLTLSQPERVADASRQVRCCWATLNYMSGRRRG